MLNLKETRPTYLEVNLDNLLYNLKLLREQIGDDVELMATVKGDFYGIGLRGTWKVLDENGADSYCVATLNEAVELRQMGTRKDILILGYTSPGEYERLIEYEIMPTMYDVEDAKTLSELSKKHNKITPIHIKVDTGMTRIGFDTSDESVDKVKEISEMENLKIAGIFSHFSNSEDPDKSNAHRQAREYHDFCKRVEEKGVDLGKKHLANSAAVIDLPEYHEDLIRNGYSLTGMYDDTVKIERMPIKLTAKLKSEISRVRTVPKGTGVGYGSTFVTEKEETTIATIPIGYCDGYKRALGNNGEVLINGQRAKVRGTICMDQMMVEVTGIDCKAGDEVVLFGYEGNEPSVFEVAKTAGTNNIDIYCSVSRRVPRVYIKDGEVVDIVDYLRD